MNALAVSPGVRGEHGVLVPRVHLVLLGQLQCTNLAVVRGDEDRQLKRWERAHQGRSLDAARAHGLDDSIDLLKPVARVGLAGH